MNILITSFMHEVIMNIYIFIYLYISNVFSSQMLVSKNPSISGSMALSNSAPSLMWAVCWSRTAVSLEQITFPGRQTCFCFSLWVVIIKKLGFKTQRFFSASNVFILLYLEILRLGNKVGSTNHSDES